MTNMQKIFHLLLLSLAGLAPAAGAQTPKWWPGYVVTPQGDTLRGQIERRDDWRYQNSVRFAGSGGQEQKYDPGELKAFCINQKQYYVSTFVEIDSPGVVIFAREIVRGHASLYEGLDVENKLAYFINQDGKTTLLPWRYLVPMLNTLIPHCPQLVFDKAAIRRRQYRYNYASLMPTLMEYNRCAHPTEPLRLMRPRDSLVVLWGAKMGGGFHSTTMTGTATRLVGGVERNGNQLGPALAVGGFVNLTKPSARLSIQVEALVSRRASKDGYLGRSTLLQYQGEANYQVWHAQVPIFLKYHFFRSHTGPFLMLGAQFAIDLDRANSRLREYNLIQGLKSVDVTLDEAVTTYGLVGLGYDFPLGNQRAFGVELRLDRSLQNQYFTVGVPVNGTALCGQLLLSYRW
jgi:hypothetical protein